MTPAEKVLVQQTFAKVVPIADQAAALFYGRLFEMDPSLRPLFKTDLVEQGKKLMQMIGVAVKGLDTLDQLVPAVQNLGSATPATASPTPTTRPSAARCCGRSRRGSARRSRPT